MEASPCDQETAITRRRRRGRRRGQGAHLVVVRAEELVKLARTGGEDPSRADRQGMRLLLWRMCATWGWGGCCCGPSSHEDSAIATVSTAASTTTAATTTTTCVSVIDNLSGAILIHAVTSGNSTARLYPRKMPTFTWHGPDRSIGPAMS